MNTHKLNNLRRYDVCIIGSGPAGMTVVAELASSGKRICVLESGKYRKSTFADDLRRVEWSELPIKANSRERMVGGASNTWGGLSALLDDRDLMGWPLDMEELTKYIKQASLRYKFPAPREFTDSYKNFSGWRGLNNIVDKVFIAVRPPFNFRSLENIFKKDHLDLFTDATVVSLRENQGEITSAHCKSADGKEFMIEADLFVLALGGIENSRILLNSNVGNEYDQVGRYFMNHPKGYSGLLKLKKSLPASIYYLPRTIDGRMVYAGLRLSEKYQSQNDLLNPCAQFELDLKFFQRYAFAIWNRLTKFSLAIISFLRPKTLRVRWFADMEARAENRVILGDEKDAFGNFIPKVNYSLGPKDKASLLALHKELRANIESLGLGQLLGNAEEVIDAVKDDASHHLGGTRMGHDPQSSVVDKNSKVHSINNLYIAGGSVFPSVGCASPTITIVALSIRLSEHLKSILGVHAHKIQNKDNESEVLKDKIVIIGAGGRVRSDVVPTLESLSNTFSIVGVFARRSGSIFGSIKDYDVQSIDNLSSTTLKDVRFLYISVPRDSVLDVLRSLPEVDGGKELVIDTPIFSKNILVLAYSKGFSRVHIAEDMIFLPWIRPVLSSGQIREVRAIHSLYRYHAIALFKVLARGSVRWGLRIKNKLYLRVGGMKALLVEPRDYTHGKLLINGHEVKIIRNNNMCTGFAFLGEREEIQKEESHLIGPIDEHDTVVTLMSELKRVGLRRFFQSLKESEDTWSVNDGVNDAKVDSIIHRYLFYLKIR